MSNTRSHKHTSQPVSRRNQLMLAQRKIAEQRKLERDLNARYAAEYDPMDSPYDRGAPHGYANFRY